MIIHRSQLNARVRSLKDCVAPLDHMPQSAAGGAVIRKYETDNPIILKIRHRPHMRLRLPTFDLQQAQQEVAKFYNSDDFMRLDMRGLPPEDGGRAYDFNGYHSHWASRALVNYIPESKGVWGKDDRELAIKQYPHLQPRAAQLKDRRPFLQDMEFYKTDVWEALPYITDYIMTHLCDNFKYMRRTHLYKMNPRGCLTFHNHRLLPWETEAAPHDEGIVHIPLHTHASVNMLAQIGDSDWVDAQHYGEGEIWLLNTYMNHAVDATACPVERLHLTIMIDFGDPKFTNVLENSL
jgi:hypothetical protein